MRVKSLELFLELLAKKAGVLVDDTEYWTSFEMDLFQ